MQASRMRTVFTHIIDKPTSQGISQIIDPTTTNGNAIGYDTINHAIIVFPRFKNRTATP